MDGTDGDDDDEVKSEEIESKHEDKDAEGRGGQRTQATATKVSPCPKETLRMYCSTSSSVIKPSTNVKIRALKVLPRADKKTSTL